MQQRVNMVTLGVQDVPRARAFYEYGLGWRACAKSSGDLAVFRAGPMLVSLMPRGELAADTGLADEAAPGQFAGVTLAYAARSREEAVVLLARAAAAGATIARRASETDWGGYAGTFVDPDGHAWELVWNPDWFAADGEPLLS